jgi:hypothetical protein
MVAGQVASDEATRGTMKAAKRYSVVLAVALLCFVPGDSGAQDNLAGCAEVFPGSSTSNAPTAAQPAASTVHICTHSGNVSFFALEYSPSRYAPIWVSYRIADTFGQGGCASMARQQMRCHFSVEDVDKCIGQSRFPEPAVRVSGSGHSMQPDNCG